MASYKALVGLDYGNPSKRVEAGEIVSDLPAQSVSWLLEQGMVELASSAAPASPKKKKSFEVQAPVVEEEV